MLTPDDVSNCTSSGALPPWTPTTTPRWPTFSSWWGMWRRQHTEIFQPLASVHLYSASAVLFMCCYCLYLICSYTDNTDYNKPSSCMCLRGLGPEFTWFPTWELFPGHQDPVGWETAISEVGRDLQLMCECEEEARGANIGDFLEADWHALEPTPYSSVAKIQEQSIQSFSLSKIQTAAYKKIKRKKTNK